MRQIRYKYEKYLRGNQVSEVTIEKSFYLLSVVFYEITKILILFLIFGLIKQEKLFLVLLVSVSLLRTNLGGIHFSTQKACLGASILIFSLMMLLGKFCILPILYGNALVLVSSFIVGMFAPISSKQRPCYSLLQKRKFKIRGILMVCCLYLFGILQPKYNNYILWAITLQIVESVLVITIRKGGLKNENAKGICSENQ